MRKELFLLLMITMLATACTPGTPMTCGNGVCEIGEQDVCPEDCGYNGYCGDGICQEGEEGNCKDCGTVLPDKCVFDGGIQCLDFEVTEDKVDLVFQNSLGHDILVTSVYAEDGDDECGTEREEKVENGENFNYELGCYTGKAGSRYDAKVNIKYENLETGLGHINTGKVSARIQEGKGSYCGDGVCEGDEGKRICEEECSPCDYDEETGTKNCPAIACIENCWYICGEDCGSDGEVIHVETEEQFKLEVGMAAVVKDYDNMMIELLGVVEGKCSSNNDCYGDMAKVKVTREPYNMVVVSEPTEVVESVAINGKVTSVQATTSKPSMPPNDVMYLKLEAGSHETVYGINLFAEEIYVEEQVVVFGLYHKISKCGNGVCEGDESEIICQEYDCECPQPECPSCPEGAVCEPCAVSSCECPTICEKECEEDCGVYDSVCGNGILEYNEGCDGKDFGNMECESFGWYNGGYLTCESDCTISTQTCKSDSPGIEELCEKTGGDFSECDSACGPQAEICTMQCVQRCHCPSSAPYWNENVGCHQIVESEPVPVYDDLTRFVFELIDEAIEEFEEGLNNLEDMKLYIPPSHEVCFESEQLRIDEHDFNFGFYVETPFCINGWAEIGLKKVDGSIHVYES